MKRKIKNLTLKQAKALCESHLEFDESKGRYNCDTCPYSNHRYDQCKLEYVFLDDYGDELVEIIK